MKIKLPFLLIIMFFHTFMMKSQNSDFENIKSLKIVFITQQLDLTPKEAEKFWPIYNFYSNKEFDLRINQTRNIHQQIRKNGGIDTFSDSDADAFLKKLMNIDSEIADTKNEMFLKLKPVIGSKKVIKLQIADVEFNRKVLEELRKRRMEQFKKNN